jgi:hypothetical protein
MRRTGTGNQRNQAPADESGRAGGADTNNNLAIIHEWQSFVAISSKYNRQHCSFDETTDLH